MYSFIILDVLRGIMQKTKYIESVCTEESFLVSEARKDYLKEITEKLAESHKEKRTAENVLDDVKKRRSDSIDDSVKEWGLCTLYAGLCGFFGYIDATSSDSIVSYDSPAPFLVLAIVPVLKGINEVVKYFRYRSEKDPSEKCISDIEKKIQSEVEIRKGILLEQYVKKYGEEDILAFAGDIFEDVKVSGCGCKRHSAREAFNELVHRIDEGKGIDKLCSDSEKEINRAKIIVAAYMRLEKNLHDYCRVTESTTSTSNERIVEKTLAQAQKLRFANSTPEISVLLHAVYPLFRPSEMSETAKRTYESFPF